MSVSGLATVKVDYYGPQCVDVTWTSVAAGAHPGYTYKWYQDSEVTVQATGASFTKTYCPTANKSVIARVVATDSDGHTASSPFFTTLIQYSGPLTVTITGPTTVTTDYYGPTCATVNWTASAAGGHLGYTYTWYLDGAVQGTGSTFSKQYCNTSLTATPKVVARDSDGHTAEKTFSTNIVYKPALAVSASGPATATIDYYGATCANVTWTAAPTNGHPGYTYAWYIDYDPKRSNTIQGTGSSLTKNYCTTSQSYEAMVIVTDSDGHTATATTTTDFTYKRQIVPTPTGPATVATNTTTPCADVTWTASASGTGHSPFTYKWYLGTSTTLQGSGSTFTKRYCSTTTNVTVKLVATASDGHSDSGTFTTAITHTSTPPPLTASISGPSESTGTTTCQTITWTANVGGGTPGYTYSWTIGTSTTVLSTTSSLTKSICLGTTTVKLTARDSASQSKTATFDTTIYKETSTCIALPCN